jgi:ATP-binding cassette subfamily B protein
MSTVRKIDKDYRILSVLNEFSSKNRGFIAGYVILGFFAQLCWVLAPFAFSQLIDSKRIFSKAVMIPIALFLAGYALEYFADIMDYYFTEKLNLTMTTWSTERLFMSFRRRFASPKMAESVSALNRVSVICTQVFREGRIFVMGLILATIVCTALLSYIHPLLGGFLTSGVIVICVLMFLCIYKGVQFTSKTEHTRDRLMEQMTDTLINMPSVFAANQIDYELEKTRKDFNKLEYDSKTALRQITAYRVGINVLYLTIVGGMFLLGAYFYRKGTLSNGLLATSIMITMYMIYNFDELSLNSNSLIKNIGQLIQTQQFLNDLHVYTNKNPDGTSRTPPADGSIVINGITVLNEEQLVLRELDLEINEGEIVLLTGRNGSGKSTLLKTIFGALPYTGSIMFGGNEIRDMESSVLRYNITYVPQVPSLFNRTVYENISYGNGASRDDVLLLMNEFGIDFVTLDDVIGNSHLSGGQQQLIYLLRACLQKNAKLVLLDEPTSALDNRTRDKAMTLLVSLMKDRTAIIVTHDDDLTQYATRKIVLDQGQVVA